MPNCSGIRNSHRTRDGRIYGIPDKKSNNMKRILLTLFVAIGMCTACDEGLPDEIFVKHVLINQNGFREYELNYVNTPIKDTIISVAVNGSSRLDRDVRVDLAVNPDTLDGYNWEKYRNDRSLYYEMLPETCYSFEGEGIVIRAGTEYSDVPIRFYLDKIDKEKNYILPISIVNVSEFSIGDPKYSTILMNVILSNEYSGTYSLSGAIREVSTGDYMDVRMSRTLRVVDPATVSFYAGNTAENAVNRENYRIDMTVNPDSTLTFTPEHPDLIEIISDEPSFDPKNPKNKILVERTVDSQNSHKSFVVTTFYAYYTYIDKTDPEDPIEMRWEGTLSRTKTVMTK